jgi:hypothetical protein
LGAQQPQLNRRSTNKLDAYTMTRRGVLLLVALLFMVAGTAVGVCMLWSRTAIAAESAARIKEGMTLAEVELILG